jgi:hypothetical protein
LSRKGIKIEVQRGFEKVSEIIHPQKAHKPKILRVELLDSEENKPTKLFGQIKKKIQHQKDTEF